MEKTFSTTTSFFFLFYFFFFPPTTIIDCSSFSYLVGALSNFPSSTFFYTSSLAITLFTALCTSYIDSSFSSTNPACTLYLWQQASKWSQVSISLSYGLGLSLNYYFLSSIILDFRSSLSMISSFFFLIHSA
jgi:hypothetical protein